jgi:hypothetical protein
MFDGVEIIRKCNISRTRIHAPCKKFNRVKQCKNNHVLPQNQAQATFIDKQLVSFQHGSPGDVPQPRYKTAKFECSAFGGCFVQLDSYTVIVDDRK